MSQNKLEALALMATEIEILIRLDSDNLIDKVVDKSKFLRSLLTT